MKASAIIIDGAAQLHLEPESNFERMVLDHFAQIPEPVLVHNKVDFFETQGGYMRGTPGTGLSLVRGVRKSPAPKPLSSTFTGPVVIPE